MQSHGILMMDIVGYELSAVEREMLSHPLVCGVTLFSRNYHDKAQLRALTEAIYQVKQPLIIAVDQEGGRVQRFSEGFTTLPSMRYWGDAYVQNAQQAKARMRTTVNTMSAELAEVGANVNFAPVLDVDDGLSTIIGHRSFAAEPKALVEVAKVFMTYMQATRFPTIGKHFPGHGGVAADSHLELPVDEREYGQLAERDLWVFAQLADVLDGVMTAHVQYPQVDHEPPTYSSHWLQEVLRQRLSFKGLCFSDDLCMAGALGQGDATARAQRALLAGCDVLLFCNDQQAVIEVLDRLSCDANTARAARIHTFMQILRGPWNHGVY